MKDNREILNEAFFKKPTYEEKLAKKMPQYAPINPKKDGSMGTPFSNVAAYQVTDTDEVKRRLSGSFGVMFGNNNLKGMASRALKTFPLLISENIEPETVVTLKKLTEEQYAEYINLLISNQVVNLADYSTNNPDGNIAIQAVDSISGSDFSKSRLGNKALRTEKITTDDVFANIPLYNLLRESPEIEPHSGNELLDALLEDAVILPSDKANDYIDFLCENMDDIIELNELQIGSTREFDSFSTRDKDAKVEDDPRYSRYKMDINKTDNEEEYRKLLARNAINDMRRGYQGLDAEGKEIYTELTNADITMDEKKLNQLVNKSVGEFLCLPDNIEIRDRFEKATFLLQSRKIAGVEYYNYLTMRLGIPVSDKARQNLVTNFRIQEVRDYSGGSFKDGKDKSFRLSKEDVAAIAGSRGKVDKIVKEITQTKFEMFLKTIRDTAVVGSASFFTFWGAKKITAHIMDKSAAAGNTFAKWVQSFGGFAPWFLNSCLIEIILAAGIGLTYGLVRLIKKLRLKIKAKKMEAYNQTRYYGWERVEKLIVAMEEAQADVRNIRKPEETYIIKDVPKDLDDKDTGLGDILKKYQSGNLTKDTAFFDPDKDYKSNTKYTLKDKDGKIIQSDNLPQDFEDNYIDLQNIYRAQQANYDRILQKNSQLVLKEEAEGPISFSKMEDMEFSPVKFLTEEEIEDTILETVLELQEDKEYCAHILSEKLLAKTSMPVEVKYIEKQPGKDVLIAPTFGARADYAYGSTEIERKENKDRKYNQPLIMTIKFKERFQDDKYSDNELTAVIGILGKVIRIPSNEMEYILKENINDRTIEGIFNVGSIGDNIGDMFAVGKISKDIKNLPLSADIWHNLEKVSALALANKVAGKRNNNIANAHIVFSQREIDAVRTDTGVDYARDARKAAALMKRYNAFTIMIANDAGQRVSIFDDPDNISWNVVPYSAIQGKDNGEQLNSVLTKMMRL